MNTPKIRTVFSYFLSLLVMLLLMTSMTNAAPMPNNVRVLLLHGLYGKGDPVEGGTRMYDYWPEFARYIVETTGSYPLFPDMGTAPLDEQLAIAKRAMDSACPTCQWHVFGYSRGGILVRMLANAYPEKVLSASSFGGPHRGCPVCDAARDSKIFGAYLKLFEPKQEKQIVEMSQASMDKINKKYPLGTPDGVTLCSERHKTPTRYFRGEITTSKGYRYKTGSVIGDVSGSFKLQTEAFYANIGDPMYGSDRFMAYTFGLFRSNYSDKIDGLVSDCSAAYGPNGDEGLILTAHDHHDIVYQRHGLALRGGITTLKDQLHWVLK